MICVVLPGFVEKYKNHASIFLHRQTCPNGSQIVAKKGAPGHLVQVLSFHYLSRVASSLCSIILVIIA